MIREPGLGSEQTSLGESPGQILGIILPFMVGIGYRLDLSLVFSLVSLVYFFLVPLVLRPLKESVSSNCLFACSLIICGGLASLGDLFIALLVPSLWGQLHVYLPVLAASPLLTWSILTREGTKSTSVLGASLWRWAIVSAFLVGTAIVREFIATGGLVFFTAPGAEIRLDMIPREWFSLPFLLMSPFVFFMVGFIYMWRQGSGASKAGIPEDGQS